MVASLTSKGTAKQQSKVGVAAAAASSSSSTSQSDLIDSFHYPVYLTSYSLIELVVPDIAHSDGDAHSLDGSFIKELKIGDRILPISFASCSSHQPSCFINRLWTKGAAVPRVGVPPHTVSLLRWMIGTLAIRVRSLIAVLLMAPNVPHMIGCTHKMGDPILLRFHPAGVHVVPQAKWAADNMDKAWEVIDKQWDEITLPKSKPPTTRTKYSKKTR